ncbi:protein of unknown function DUF1416 [Acidothermus cellulolyticus 11B]|jgi:hypothetical protein|uniref:alpha-amylase n=1 Tax=Acidothermus cellulolyticus (strain ATCC 43068 / DSM 8971 / 11B) TaxID=351607 RepID=A0LQX6_ACIC1|nr:DUF1416 domain-containing protein [Acidothermus cellulolyticus]ABK51836.1 protein of unknown function DUF1416 [Acidothermus cellulolyticus 11B]
MCGALTDLPTEVDAGKQAVIQGVVRRGDAPVHGYVRLLNADGEFVAEVPTSATGAFRFYAAPGTWTVRVLVPGATADREVQADLGVVTNVEVELPA